MDDYSEHTVILAFKHRGVVAIERGKLCNIAHLCGMAGGCGMGGKRSISFSEKKPRRAGANRNRKSSRPDFRPNASARQAKRAAGAVT
jgi:hypothetical protein